MSFQAGAVVSVYKILGLVGSGGLGHVYKVEHTLTKRIEAMKVVINDHLADSENTQRFLREIQVQASLDHPNIASVHNAFALNNEVFMVMELVEGETLESLLAHGPIPTARAVDYACQVLTALSVAHLHGIIHRDVTPANIIVTPEGGIKLTDFGLAKAPAQLRLTQSGRLMGSPAFMSPEQVRGASTLDARTDIYSMGAVLYAMVTGRKPFDGDDAFTIMRAQVETKPAAPMTIDGSLPAGISEVILKALEKDPRDRFQTAEEFRKALLEVGESVQTSIAQREVPHTVGRRGALKVTVAVVTIAVVLAETGMPPFPTLAEEDAPFEKSSSAESSAQSATPASTLSVQEAERAPLPHPSGGTKKKRRSRFRRTLEKIVHPWR
jgi:serine/threonine-protein kinase